MWLGGDLCVWVDAFKPGQSFLFNLLQMLLQRQISIGEEPEEHIEDLRIKLGHSVSQCECQPASLRKAAPGNYSKQQIIPE